MNYSQNGEQAAIFEAIKGREVGSFLDIGANDGEFASNTLGLAEAGWSGVLVEPSYHAFGNLLKLHGSNQKLRLVQAAVGISHRLTQFWEAGLVSTTTAENYMHWRGQVSFSEPYMLPQITVNDLINAFPAILDGGRLQVVSIDTEGSTLELFLNWPWHRSKPHVMVVEFDRNLEIIEAYAISLGYEITYKSNENVVLVAK